MEKVLESNEYAVCGDCNQVMAPGNGCSALKIRIKGKIYNRIKAGSVLDLFPEMKKGDVCHDCNVTVGQYHHYYCDMEGCPVCHGQFFICGCYKTFIYLKK